MTFYLILCATIITISWFDYVEGRAALLLVISGGIISAASGHPEIPVFIAAAFFALSAAINFLDGDIVYAILGGAIAYWGFTLIF